MDTNQSEQQTTPKRSWRSFSLRTLFVLTLLSCFAFLAIGIKYRNKVRERELIAELENYPFIVYYDYQWDEVYRCPVDNKPPGLATIRYFLGDDFFATPRAIVSEKSYLQYRLDEDPILTPLLRILSQFKKYPRITINQLILDETPSQDKLDQLRNLPLFELVIGRGWSKPAVPHLETLTSLEDLTIQSAEFNDEGMKAMKRLPLLRTLKFYISPTRGTAITDEGFTYFAPLHHLESLTINNGPFSDQALVAFAQSHQLRSISLYNTKIRGDGLRYFQELDQVEVLKITNTDLNRGLESLKKMSRLHQLFLSNTLVTDAESSHLSGLVSIKNLNLENTPISNLEFIEGLPNLERLSLMGTNLSDQSLQSVGKSKALKYLFLEYTKISDVGLENLNSSHNLRRLLIDGTQITDQGIQHLRDLPLLEALSLTETNITDESIPYLKQLSKLRELYLRETKVTSNGIAELNQHFPNIYIKY